MPTLAKTQPKRAARRATKSTRAASQPEITPSTSEQTEARSRSLQEKVVLVVLSLTAPGNHRNVRDKGRDILNTEADKKRLNVVKRLLDSKEQENIGRLDGEIRGYVHRLALPSPFKTGTHAIPIDLLGTMDARLRAYEEERAAMVEKFIEVYDTVKEQARVKLGPLFREGDYLTPDGLRAAYTMTWQYVQLTAPGQLNAVDSALYQREQRRLQAQWDDALGEMRDALRVGLAELVDDMVKRLTDAGGEDAKRFKPSKLLDRFTEFLGTFDARNVTSDAALAELAGKARLILRGVSSETLTQMEDVQTRVKKEFGAVQKVLVQLETESASRRRIRLEDE